VIVLCFTFTYILPWGSMGWLLDRVLIRRRLLAEFEQSHRRLKKIAEADVNRAV
jgi:hypothetical protein